MGDGDEGIDRDLSPPHSYVFTLRFRSRFQLHPARLFRSASTIPAQLLRVWGQPRFGLYRSVLYQLVHPAFGDGKRKIQRDIKISTISPQ